MVVAEIKYSVCPRPFRRPREARQVRDRLGMGKGRVRDQTGRDRELDNKNLILLLLMQDLLADGTLFWGVAVERVEVKDVRVPEQLMRAMAAEAEAAREARAKVIAAEGEHKASRALRHAAEIVADSPAALQVSK